MWHRAAELQAEAALRLEERSRELVPAEEDDAVAGAGFAIDNVRAAAVEAGISPEFVDRALAERAATGALVPKTKKGLLHRLFVGDIPDSVEVSRVIGGSPAVVYDAMQRIFPKKPYSLVLSDTQGEDPLSGAVLVFDVPKFTQFGDSAFSYEMAHGGFSRFFVTLHPLAHDPPNCELAIRSPLGASKRTAAIVGGLLSGAIVGLGSFLFVAKGVDPAWIAAWTLGAATVASWGWRGIYRYSVNRSKKAVAALLGAINSDIQTDGAFSRGGKWPAVAGDSAIAGDSETPAIGPGSEGGLESEE